MSDQVSTPKMRQRMKFKGGDRARFIKDAGHRCAYCGRVSTTYVPPSNIDPDGYIWNVDHVVPVSTGRPEVWEVSNLALACATCNSLKANHELSVLIPELERMRAHIDRMIDYASEWPAS